MCALEGEGRLLLPCRGLVVNGELACFDLLPLNDEDYGDEEHLSKLETLSLIRGVVWTTFWLGKLLSIACLACV